jgi:hypothetical protein
MKQWTDIPLHQNEAAKPQTFNNNIEKVLNEYNGNLNGNNLPVYSVQTDDIVDPAPTTGIAGPVSGFRQELTSQGFYSIRRSSSFEGGSDVWTPILQLDLATDDWSKGWNRLAYYSGFNQCLLNFDSREGMLVGCATIDWAHGTDSMVVTAGDDPPISGTSTRGHDWKSEWGVFVNDVLVARTGQIPPKRHTSSIPFSIPCGSQNIKVDVRWISIISDYATTGKPHGSVFEVYSAEIWCRNVIR